MEKLTSLPFISIIIPAKNEEKLIRSCITSLHALDYPKEKLEIIVVDGLSTDQTDIVARELGATVISNVKQIVSPGRNIGFENAKGELIAFTDADCIVDKNWLASSVKYFEQDETVACVGGPNPPRKAKVILAKRLVLFLINPFLRLVLFTPGK